MTAEFQYGLQALYFWGGRCILGSAHLVYFTCPFHWMLDFIQTPRLTVARLFSFLSSSCSCWKILSWTDSVSWPNSRVLVHNFFCTLNSTCSCTSNSTYSYTANSTCSCTSNSTCSYLHRTQTVLVYVELKL